jgi:8-oxo-dGTP pyrophosphatase MutT (NUDIX family)
MSISQHHTVPSHKEHVVPIVVKHVTLETHMDTAYKKAQLYHNVILDDLDAVRYIENEKREGNFVRKRLIIRYNSENVDWPDHPLNVDGKIQGAIVILCSKDDRILLVRNRKLWGLPKGARNFNDFMRLKSLTDDHYRKTGEIMEHEEASFTYDNVESSMDNACREVREETGIIIDEHLLKPFIYHNQSGSYCAYDGYYYEYPRTSKDHSQDLQENGTDHENDELLWVTVQELKKMFENHRQNRLGNHPRVFNHVTYGYLEEYMRTWRK